MLIKVFCVVSMLSKLPPVVCLRGGGATGLLNKGGGSNRLPVEFSQVQTSTRIIITAETESSCSCILLFATIKSWRNMCQSACMGGGGNIMGWGQVLGIPHIFTSSK